MRIILVFTMKYCYLPHCYPVCLFQKELENKLIKKKLKIKTKEKQKQKKIYKYVNLKK